MLKIIGKTVYWRGFMNKKNVLDFLLLRYEKEKKISPELVNQLRETIMEIETAQSLFNITNDPKLIDSAIYIDEAARKRFDYLFTLAKQEYKDIQSISVEYQESLEL